MLGWKDKLAAKLSTILSDSSNYSTHFDPPSTPPPQPQGATVAEGDLYGRIHHLYLLFLFSLLPAAGTGSNEHATSQNVENEASSSDLRIFFGQKRQTEKSVRQDEFSDYKLEFETHGPREDESGIYEEDIEWELVTETGSKTCNTSHHSWVSQKAIPFVPDLSDESSLLSDNLRGFLNACLPTVVKGCQWVLLYSTQKHGISLLTLIRKSADLPGPAYW